ncbi:MAG TPA: tetratricopeptide repeat protein [Polyangiaceae bacterium]|nr:tetratricopeptide repeat protein [Polyangiaceae bacterium]
MPFSPRLRKGVQSLALSLLMAGITTAAVKIFGWKFWPRAQPTLRSATRPRAHALADDQRLVAVSAEPPIGVPAAKDGGVLVAPAPRKLSASDMFAAAKLARGRGDTTEALRLCKQLEEFFPNSPEGINAHVALGMLYLTLDQAELALQEFATFRRIGDPELKAEAYWGQAQALRKLARHDDERTVLTELIASYPRSAYVAAARARLGELSSDAGAR